MLKAKEKAFEWYWEKQGMGQVSKHPIFKKAEEGSDLSLALDIAIKETLDEVDRKVTELENKRNTPKQNPDECELLEVSGIPYYPSKQIYKIDSEIWLMWRKWIEEKKELNNGKTNRT